MMTQRLYNTTNVHLDLQHAWLNFFVAVIKYPFCDELQCDKTTRFWYVLIITMDAYV